MGNIRFEVNNGQVLNIEQRATDEAVRVYTTHNAAMTDKPYTISAGDMVMLFNLYRYIKDNDIQNDFINYNGKN